jgi:hypothetical protein
MSIAYLSFAVENSYDAPMLAAAQAVASTDGATMKVFDANNSPQTQLEGGAQAIATAHLTGKVILVGYGASAAALAGVKSGAWYADVAQAPASEGREAVQAMVKALQTGQSSGGIDPVASLPNAGVVTRANVSQFTAEWPG